jgi:hypothetical protein
MRIYDTIKMTNGGGDLEVSFSTIPSGTPTVATGHLPNGHASDLKVGVEIRVTCGADVIYGVTARSHSHEEAIDAALVDLQKWLGSLSRVHETAVNMRRMFIQAAGGK